MITPYLHPISEIRDSSIASTEIPFTNCTAAVLRAKECVMKTATTIQENAEDIYAEAQQINEERAAQAAQEFDGEAEAAKSADADTDWTPELQ